MRLSPTQRELREQALPPAEVTRQRARDYMRTVDVTEVRFGTLVGYGRVAINSFLRNAYAGIGSDVLIREAIERYIERHPIQPTSAGKEAVRLYETENVHQIRSWLERCLKRACMIVGYGPPGSQKTFVAEQLVMEFNRRELGNEASTDRVYLVRCSVGIRPRDLLAKICRELGVPAAETIQRCFASLRLAVRGRRVVLIIDEAQLAGIDALEALRELHDTEGVGLLFLGSHQLNDFFTAKAAMLEQFNSRIEDRAELVGISEGSARAIIEVELPGMPPEVVAEAIRFSFVKDAYSRTKGKQYCSARRLFKTIENLREQLAADGAQLAALPAVIQ